MESSYELLVLERRFGRAEIELGLRGYKIIVIAQGG
jgi:hypothetical protein